jgi:hypothetical protein
VSKASLGVLCLAIAFASADALAETVAVRYPEGVVHGFLSLRALDGEPLADGDLIQSARGSTVTSRLVLRFHDGSVQDETVVFSQRARFRLVSDHLVQRGPTFPHPVELSIDALKSLVSVRTMDDDGKEKTSTERMELPEDLANGMVSVLLKNLPPGAARSTFSMLVLSPKPRLIKLVVAPDGEDTFHVGAATEKATGYVVKVEIGGVAGVVAPLIGKQPPDTRVWILGGPAPTFLKSEGPLFMGGPSWRLELTSPSWGEEAKK